MELSCYCTCNPVFTDSCRAINIIILTEHWLWPFKFSKLDTIFPGYKGTGISDTRLHEQSALTRDCEGVGILWNKSLPISNVLSIHSDRIFAIQLSVSSSVSLSIVGIYLPTTDSPLTLYKECLQELENVIFSLQTDGSVLVMSDFNATLASLIVIALVDRSILKAISSWI